MKNTLSILLISILIGICSAQTSINEFDASTMRNINDTDDTTLLEFYCQYSPFTDPGKYEYLYENLPNS